MDKTLSEAPKTVVAAHGETLYVRFSLSQRIEHLVLLVSFSMLGITGLAQKYATSQAGGFVISLFTGIDGSRIVHRWSAVILMAVSVYHVVASLYRILVLRHPLSITPLIDDFKHLFQDILYYFGKRAHKAYYGRYSYAEKVEYLAVVWGTVIMAITGFMMWNPIATTRFLPGEWIPAAKAAHGGEALLAVLAIILWHFYHVHIRHLNKSMFTGTLTEEEMRHEHPAELAAIRAGKVPQPPADAERKKRERIFYPIAAVIVAVSAFGLYKFITLEETALALADTPRGETAPIFVQITPTPSPTPPATATPPPLEAGNLTWEGGIGELLGSKCNACHVASALGGLSLATYEDALQGGDTGPGVVPGDPDASVLVQKQLAGGHPGQLAEDELAKIIEWIQAGAPK